MDFKNLIEEAETWIKDKTPDFKVLSNDPDERKITFSLTYSETKTFYVVCPLKKEQGWHVWSTNEDILCSMQDTQDYVLSERQKTISDILARVQKDVKEPPPVAAKEDESDDDGCCLDDDCDDEDDLDDYYNELDVDATTEVVKKKDPEEDSADAYFMGSGSPAAVQRLVKDLKNLKTTNGKFGVRGEPRGNNLFIWDVKLSEFDKKSLLFKDLTEYARKFKREASIHLEMKFPASYPMEPPFIRVLRPKFKFLTGHVTIGGSICMELLTRSGWMPTNDIEGILVQVRSEIMSDANTRLELSNDKCYDETEARSSFERLVQKYGWNEPESGKSKGKKS